MTAGPGKYDELASYVRERAEALAAIVIVIGGNKGSGFSVQSTGEDLTSTLPKLLRGMADQIEKDMRGILQ